IDFFPRWSADGRRLAFLRATDLKKPIAQVAVMPAGGGEAKVITSFALGAEYLAWSPDGLWLCVVAKSWGESLKDLSEDDRNRKPKRITRFPYRFDNRGWLHDRIRQLWLVDPNGENEPRRLTEGDFDEVMPAWHPDCDRIVFLTDRHPRQGLEAGSDVYQVTLDGALTQPTRRGGWLVPVYAPDGTLHLIGDPAVDYPRLTGYGGSKAMERRCLSPNISIAPRFPSAAEHRLCPSGWMAISTPHSRIRAEWKWCALTPMATRRWSWAATVW
ncbi:MAG: TolB family protein, partial [Acidimicrobiia bacterium]